MSRIQLPPGSRSNGDATTGENRISIVFPNDHDWNGTKVEILNVTPEQIAIAMLHLQRGAMMLLAQRDQAIMAAQAEQQAARDALAREKGH